MRTLVSLPLLLAACGPAEPTVSAEVLGQTATADLSETLDHLEELYFSVADTHRSSGTDDACTDTVGTCTWCAQWTGELPQGRFSARPVAVPCGGERADEATGLSYTVDDGWLEGSWVQADGRWTVSALGGRHATVEPRSDDDDPAVDASWTIDELTVSYEGERRHAVHATLAFADGPVTWTVALSGRGDQLVGTLSSDDGASCTVFGTVGEVPEVHCAR